MVVDGKRMRSTAAEMIEVRTDDDGVGRQIPVTGNDSDDVLDFCVTGLQVGSS